LSLQSHCSAALHLWLHPSWTKKLQCYIKKYSFLIVSSKHI
jgi:hypothetical protein